MTKIKSPTKYDCKKPITHLKNKEINRKWVKKLLT